jgi:tripartite-type tricarboxylate transporter receptor subunit TctC
MDLRTKLLRTCVGVATAAAVCVLSIAPLHAQMTPASPAVSFSGKTITLYVGFAAGGSAATEALVVAKHLPRFISGHPTVVIGYRPGAGGRILNNYLYNAAPANGLEIGRLDNGVAIASLLEDSAIKFDARKFGWIGSFAGDGWVLVLRRAAGIASMSDLKNTQIKPKIGSISAVHKTFTNAKLLQELFGLRFDMVTGYRSGNDIELAIMRGEVDGAVAAYGGFMQRSFQYYKSGELSVLLQSGRGEGHESLRELENVPVVWSAALPQTSSLLKAVNLPWNSPFVVPPGTPREVLATLRTSFEALSRDAEFQSEYLKVVGTDVDFTSGERLAADVATIAQSPPSVVDTLRHLYANN